MNKWLNVKKEHVLEAIKVFDETCPDFPTARSTFLLFNGKKYPAKHIRGIAYEIANGASISKDKYTGGKETMLFLRKLGFEVVHSAPDKVNEGKETKTVKQVNKGASSSLDVVEQKNALQVILQKHVGIIEAEKKFSWLKTPDLCNPDQDYLNILRELTNHNPFVPNIKSNYSLLSDIVISEHKIIIEYDERQHFSLARKMSLLNYPESVKLFYDKNAWITACESIRAVDNYPPGRDEVRAFYDCVRDIEAFKNGYLLIRIKHGDFDWRSEDADRYLLNLLKPYLNKEAAKDDSKLLAYNRVGNMTESSTVKIGRAILNLLTSKHEIESSGNPWNGHKEVMKSFIRNNKEDYFRRLENIRGIALENNVTMLQLPACTAVYGNGVRLERYFNLFAEIPWVITGTFNSEDWNDENLMILNYGKKLEMFDSGIVKHIHMDCVQVMAAISSTITGIKKSWGEKDTWGEIVESKLLPPKGTSKILALDSGHHQYNGRYTMSLEAVLRHLNKFYNDPAVVLSYWRFKGGAVNCPWVYANKKIIIEREEIKIKDKDDSDILDLVNF